MNAIRFLPVAVLVPLAVACSSDPGETPPPPRVSLSFAEFEIGSAVHGDLYWARDTAPDGLRAVASNAPDTCAAIGSSEPEAGLEALQVYLAGEPDDGCVIVGPDDAEAPANCSAEVVLTRVVGPRKLYRVTARSGTVTVTRGRGNRMAFAVEAEFPAYPSSPLVCEHEDDLQGELATTCTCMLPDGSETTCQASGIEPCCDAGQTGRETLRVTFETTACDGACACHMLAPSCPCPPVNGNGGARGSGGSGGGNPCDDACGVIRECTDPFQETRCRNDCEGSADQACLACYAEHDCEELFAGACSTACASPRCWSDLECDLHGTEFCDIEAEEPRCTE